MYIPHAGRVVCLECGFETHSRQLILLRKSACLGCSVLLCFVVCMTLLASFFLPSSSLINMCIYISQEALQMSPNAMLHVCVSGTRLTCWETGLPSWLRGNFAAQDPLSSSRAGKNTHATCTMFLAIVCKGAMPLVSSATKFISDRLELSDGINCSERRGNVCVPVFVAVASLYSVWVYFILSLNSTDYIYNNM